MPCARRSPARALTVGVTSAAAMLLGCLRPCAPAVSEDENSEEMSMEEITALCEEGTIADETLVFIDGMEDWATFGEIKYDLNWEDDSDDDEESPGYTTLYYSTGDTEDGNSDEIDMREVMRLMEEDVIVDETMVFCDGMDDWDTFEVVKYMLNWDGVYGDEDEEEGESGPPSEIYYETADGDNVEVTIEEARELVSQGVITPETKVWAENLDDWTPLAECAESLGLGDGGGEEEATAEGVEEGDPHPGAAETSVPAEAPTPAAKPKAAIPKGKIGFKKSKKGPPPGHHSSAGMSNTEQAEFFLKKFNRHDDVTRPKVMILRKEFESFDTKNQGELEEDQAMRMLEARGEAKSLREIRSMVADIDIDKNRCYHARIKYVGKSQSCMVTGGTAEPLPPLCPLALRRHRKLSFLEWCCAILDKSWEELHSEVEVEVVVVETDEEKAARAEMRRQAALSSSADAAAAEAEAENAKAQAEAEEKAAGACTINRPLITMHD